MKDYIRLIGQRKGFYLTMLILSLLITIIGTNFHINISFKDGRNLVANLNNFVNQYSIVGFGFLTVLVFLLVFLNKFQMNDQKTKEFLETLPVKRITLELFDYVALSTMLILDGVVSMLLYIVRFGVKQGSDLSQLVVMFLYVFANYSFLYICMSEFKNLIIGAVFSGLFLAFSRVLPELIYDAIFVSNDAVLRILEKNGMTMRFETFFHYVQAICSPQFYFNHLRMIDGKCENDYFIPTIIMLTIIDLLFIAMVVILAKNRELSKGKLFYHNFLNVVFFGMSGLIFFFFLEEFTGGILALILTLVGEAVVICVLNKKSGRIRELPVVEMKRKKWPILSCAFVPYLLTTLAFSLTALYFYIVLSAEPIRRSFVSMFSTEQILCADIDWFSCYFSLDMIYGYMMFLLVGFIVFKCVLFAKETLPRREFYGTLPVKRNRAFVSRLLLDFGVCIIPMISVIAAAIGYLLFYQSFLIQHAGEDGLVYYKYQFKTIVKSVLSIDAIYDRINELIGQQLLWLLAGLGVAIFIIGIMYLIDAVVVSGIYKIVFTGAIGVFLFMASLITLEFIPDLEIIGIFFGVLWGYLTAPGVIVDAVLGLLMILLAGRICRKRDLSKSGFYIKNVQYLFAFISSMDFGMLMFLGMGCSFKPLPGMLMIIGMIALFCLMIYYFTPGRENAFKFRKKQK